MNHAEVRTKIQSFVQLNQPGWDSYNAKPVSQAAIDTALALADRLFLVGKTPDAVVPTPNGGVQFEWDDLLLGMPAEMEALSGGGVVLWFDDPAGSIGWSLPLRHLMLDPAADPEMAFAGAFDAEELARNTVSLLKRQP